MLQIDEQNVAKMAELLRTGAVLGLPTETVYGLAVSLDSEAGITKLIKIKERDFASGKVFTLVPKNRGEITKYCVVKPAAKELIDRFFPGALTLVLEKSPNFKHAYFDHFEKIGVRIPDTELFSALLPLSGALLLTSANRKGEEVVQSLAELQQVLPEVDAAVDGFLSSGIASTVYDATTAKILRQGAVKP